MFLNFISLMVYETIYFISYRSLHIYLCQSNGLIKIHDLAHLDRFSHISSHTIQNICTSVLHAMPWMSIFSMDPHSHNLVIEDETPPFIHPSSLRVPLLALQKWNSQHIISPFPMIEFPSCTSTMSSVIYILDDVS